MVGLLSGVYRLSKRPVQQLLADLFGLSISTGMICKLQRRSADKELFAGLWSNTCCSHPRSGEQVEEAGRRRLREELGLDGAPVWRGVFRYRARDAESGLVEHEIDHVLVGRASGDPRPDPTEIGDWTWVRPDALIRWRTADPTAFTPWFPLVLAALGGAAGVGRAAPGSGGRLDHGVAG